MFDLMVGILLTAVIKKQRNVDNATLYQGKNGIILAINAIAMQNIYDFGLFFEISNLFVNKNALKVVLVTLKFLQKIEFTNCHHNSIVSYFCPLHANKLCQHAT